MNEKHHIRKQLSLVQELNLSLSEEDLRIFDDIVQKAMDDNDKYTRLIEDPVGVFQESGISQEKIGEFLILFGKFRYTAPSQVQHLIPPRRK